MNILKTTLAVFTLTVITSGLVSGQETPPPAENAKDEAVSSTPASTQLDTDDAEAVKELALALRKQLSGTNEELAVVGRDIAQPLIASFRHDLNIVRVDQRRRRMESARVGVIQMAEDAAGERQELLAQMHQELARIKTQFADDDAHICEQEQVAVVKAFTVRLQALKLREAECRNKADETSKELVALRRDKVSRERVRWLAEKTPELAPADKIPVPRLDWVRSLNDEPKQPESTVAPQESLASVLATLEELND